MLKQSPIYRLERVARLHKQYPQIWETRNEPQFLSMMIDLSRRVEPSDSVFDLEVDLVWENFGIARSCVEVRDRRI